MNKQVRNDISLEEDAVKAGLRPLIIRLSSLVV